MSVIKGVPLYIIIVYTILNLHDVFQNEDLQSRVEELQNRVLSMSDELRQSQTKWMDATRELRESEDKVKKKDDQ